MSYYYRSAEVCYACHEKGYEQAREFMALVSGHGDKIIWYECGHVLIVKDGRVVQQFDYNK